MTNIASALKAEIARVARKEIRGEIEGLKKASAQHRTVIAQLRRELAVLQKALKEGQRLAAAQARAAGRASSSTQPVGSIEDDGTPRRFSAKRLAAHRTKLGLSAADYGKLVSISGATIYNWEQGKTRPSPEQVQALGLVKLMSPTVIKARVAELGSSSPE
ncbi:Helix-turn-helix domain protein [Xylophilus ampelinus]|nr:Helix-turn-helix domain protein [Xylophilus ampelinus]